MKWLSILLIVILIILFAAPVQSQTDVPPSLPICTQAQHDKFTTKGPDGALYARWHPQVLRIDANTFCLSRHEHGSDPGTVLPSLGWPYEVSAADVPFGYVAAHHMMPEAHEGFKVFAFDDREGHLWRISLHMGSSGAGRVCVRFHEIQVLIVDSRTWDVLASVGFMGDFGRSRANNGGDLTPTACPTQGADARADGSTGERQFRVEPNTVEYAPWRLDAKKLLIPIALPNWTVWTDNSINHCQDMTCDVLVPSYNVYGKVNDGANRFFQLYPGTGIKSTAVLSGTFYTDPLGRTLAEPGDPHAIKQYIRPGSAFGLAGGAKCFQFGIAAKYNCGGYGQGWPYSNYTGMVQAPN